jgi:hypothetical protein
MPKITVYIRNEDIAKWKAIEKKTEFMHMAINARVFKGVELGKPVPIPKHALLPNTNPNLYLEKGKFPPSAASML